MACLTSKAIDWPTLNDPLQKQWNPLARLHLNIKLILNVLFWSRSGSSNFVGCLGLIPINCFTLHYIYGWTLRPSRAVAERHSLEVHSEGLSSAYRNETGSHKITWMMNGSSSYLTPATSFLVLLCQCAFFHTVNKKHSFASRTALHNTSTTSILFLLLWHTEFKTPLILSWKKKSLQELITPKEEKKYSVLILSPVQSSEPPELNSPFFHAAACYYHCNTKHQCVSTIYLP